MLLDKIITPSVSYWLIIKMSSLLVFDIDKLANIAF